MRVAVRTDLKGADLFAYLKENKGEIIAIKKSMPIKSEPLGMNYTHQETKEFGVKAEIPTEEKKLIAPDEAGSIMVRVVANSSMVVDSHQDVMLGDSWTKSIRENGTEGKNIISHIHDHIHEVGAKIGIVRAINTVKVAANVLGFGGTRKVNCLVFETEVKRSFNNRIYNMYKEEAINQHSIGLQYVKVELAINSDDPAYKEEKKIWDKFYSQLLNPEAADDKGYFWAVQEARIFENSAVLIGSNKGTPTIETAKHVEPSPADTQKHEPSPVDTRKAKFMLR